MKGTGIDMRSIIIMLKRLFRAGLTISSRTTREKLCEIVELPKKSHPWFLGCQFHPEFTFKP